MDLTSIGSKEDTGMAAGGVIGKEEYEGAEPGAGAGAGVATAL